MKIYAGWVLEINGSEYTIICSNKIRSTTFYILKGASQNKSIRRENLIAAMESGDARYVRSVAISSVSTASLAACGA